VVPWRGNPKRCWLQMLVSHISLMPPTLRPHSQYLRYLGVCSFSILSSHIVCQGPRVDKFGALFWFDFGFDSALLGSDPTLTVLAEVSTCLTCVLAELATWKVVPLVFAELVAVDFFRWDTILFTVLFPLPSVFFFKCVMINLLSVSTPHPQILKDGTYFFALVCSLLKHDAVFQKLKIHNCHLHVLFKQSF